MNIYLVVSIGQKSSSGLAELFRLRFSHDITDKLSLGLQTSEAQLGLKDQLPKSLTWLSAGLKDSPWGTVHRLGIPTAWHLASPRWSDTRKVNPKWRPQCFVT